jgi:hypothetical protein
MSDARQYVRVYYEIIDDERFVTVIDNEATLGTWLRLLMSADAVWPSSADIPRWVKPEPLKALVDAGLIDLMAGDRFRVHGLDKERERRSQTGRAGGLASGRVRGAGTTVIPSLNDRSATVERIGNLDEHRRAKTSRASRAGGRAKATGTANVEDADPLSLAEAFLVARRASVAGGTKSHTTLVQLVDAHGAKAVIAAMEALPGPLHDGAQYIYGARNALRPIPRSNGSTTAAPDNGAVKATKKLIEDLQAVPATGKTFEELVPPEVLR